MAVQYNRSKWQEELAEGAAEAGIKFSQSRKTSLWRWQRSLNRSRATDC